MAKEDYFVRIQDPKETRKIILENTRDVLRILQGYEDFKIMRERTSHAIRSFKTNMGEIRSLVNGLRKLLPKVNVKIVKKPAVPKVQVEKAPKELKKLEQELAEIESKLSNL